MAEDEVLRRLDWCGAQTRNKWGHIVATCSLELHLGLHDEHCDFMSGLTWKEKVA